MRGLWISMISSKTGFCSKIPSGLGPIPSHHVCSRQRHAVEQRVGVRDVEDLDRGRNGDRADLKCLLYAQIELVDVRVAVRVDGADLDGPPVHVRRAARRGGARPRARQRPAVRGERVHPDGLDHPPPADLSDARAAGPVDQDRRGSSPSGRSRSSWRQGAITLFSSDHNVTFRSWSAQST